MTRLRPLLLALSLAPVVLAGVAWLLWHRSTITVENGEKIRVGMSRLEVEAILGGPERNETSGRIRAETNGVGIVDLEGRVVPGVWASDCVLILVTFDANGVVSSANCEPCRPADGRIERVLRRWFGI